MREEVTTYAIQIAQVQQNVYSSISSFCFCRVVHESNNPVIKSRLGYVTLKRDRMELGHYRYRY